MREEPLLRLRGLADDTTELCVYEDHVASVTYRSCLIFRKRIAQSMWYRTIQRVLVREGPRYGTLHLEDSRGHVINIAVAGLAEVREAGMLISERIYRAHVGAGGEASDVLPARLETLAALHEQGLLTDAYFEAKRQDVQ